jgi:hypothetical protein
MKKIYYRLVINTGALLTACLSVFSGFVIQFSYHMGHHGKIDSDIMVFSFNYYDWTYTHKISILLLSVFVILHVIQHWSWYNTIVRTKLISKNKQVVTLTIIFVMVALTGYIPWIIDLTTHNQIVRKMILEIHDKLTLILFIFLLIHITKRLKWFAKTLKGIYKG